VYTSSIHGASARPYQVFLGKLSVFEKNVSDKSYVVSRGT